MNGKEAALLEYAKELRRKMTKEERHLWYDFLKGHSLKFYKQKVIDGYIVDFYCHKARLVIELDGSQHYESEKMAYDQVRTRRLEQQGLIVIRFSNLDVNQNFDGVCQAIELAIKERIGEPPLSQLC